MLATLLLNLFLAQAIPEKICSNTPTILTGSVSEVDKMPPELYGKWAIHSTLLQAENKDEFKEVTSDIWIFSKTNGAITLTNPVTEASATISVDEVVNNKAKFSRQSENFYKHERETVQINISNERFSGIDTFIIEKYKKGKLISQNIVKYKLQGTKISGSNEIFEN